MNIKKNAFLLIFGVILVFFSCRKDVQIKHETEKPIKRAVFIAGQSNVTWGEGSVALPSDFPNKNLFQLGRNDVNFQIVPLTFYGTYHHSRNELGGCFGSIFLYHYYNKLKQDYPNKEVQLLLVPCAAEASGWADWQYPANSWRTDGAYMADIVKRIKWAKNNGYQIDAFLWHQGETDAIGQTINYKDIIKNFIQSMRDYVGNQNLPFILGEMVQSWVATNPIYKPYQEIINSIPDEVPFTKAISATGLTLKDWIHFDASAHVEMGKRYFDQFLLADANGAPVYYSLPTIGQHLIYNFNSISGEIFPDIFSSIRFGINENDARYSVLGDIWKYKNTDGYYHFKLEVVSGTGINGGVFEWKQRINPFGLSEKNFSDKLDFKIFTNTIGLNVKSGQGFSSLVYDSDATTNTLFHGDTRAGNNNWWFSIGQVAPFNNNIPLLETNNTVTHVRLYCITD